MWLTTKIPHFECVGACNNYLQTATLHYTLKLLTTESIERNSVTLFQHSIESDVDKTLKASMP